MKIFDDLGEKKFISRLYAYMQPLERLSSLEWGERYRRFSDEESSYEGRFNPDLIPSLEYVYDCYDNSLIYILCVMKGSQIGWSELCNTCEGRLIHLEPKKMQIVFAGREASKTYSREKFKPFFTNTKVLAERINQDNEKESFNYFKFPGGFLKLTTAGSISNLKTSSIAYIRVEEPDDVRDDVKGQGDTLDLLKGRQKTIPIGQKKLVFGGTPTDEDFSRVANAYKESNQLVFKAECHHCGSLVELKIEYIKYDEYQDRYIDPIFGIWNPETAYFECPCCTGIWTDIDKDKNIRNGKKHGFYDFTGNFSKGWHPKFPERTEIFGFHIPEMISTLSNSTFVEIAKKKIKALIAKDQGKEGLLKSLRNNVEGLPFSSAKTAMDMDQMIALRKNYPEHIVPYEGRILTCGIDVQENRFAIVIRAWGRNNNSWLVSWFEIFGDVKNIDDPIWKELAEKTVFAQIPHVTGKPLPITAISIDSADQTRNVYTWVFSMLEHNSYIFATKGTDTLDNLSQDEIYKEPAQMDSSSDSHARKTIAETMGVTVFRLGAHKAHSEILDRIILGTNPNALSNVYYFNQQSYGSYEEQITSCRAIINPKTNRLVYKLKPGKRKEAMDCEKNALHAAIAVGVPFTTDTVFSSIENYLGI